MQLTKSDFIFLTKHLHKDNPNLHHVRGALFDKYHYNKLSLLGYYKDSIRRAKLKAKTAEIARIANDTVESDEFNKTSLCYIPNETKGTVKVIAKKAIEQALINQLPKYLKETKCH